MNQLKKKRRTILVPVVMHTNLPNFRLAVVFGVLVTLGMIVGCQKTEAPPASPTKTTGPATAPVEQAASRPGAVVKDQSIKAPVQVERIEFQDGQGESFAVLERGGKGSRLLDGQGKELARYSPSSKGRVAVRDPGDTVLGWIVVREDRLQVRAADGATVRFRFQRRENGNWKLEDGDDNLICRINRRSDGWEVKDPEGARVARVRKSENTTTLSDAKGKSLVSTTADIDGLVVACLEMGGVESLGLRGGVMLALMDSFVSRQETR